ncbi:MAG: hypothetical protein LBP80_02230 [Treponema sp.]|nr:hypothetical protein [Treponema sp.]
MKKTGFFVPWALALISAALPALPLASCTLEDSSMVDYDMRGTWECTEEDWLNDYTLERGYGRLVLDDDTITITGPVAHLKGFTRGIALEAYTEEAEDGKIGLLYIKDRGILQSPVSYRRWQSSGKPNKIDMLTLTGGGVADETLKKVGN